MSSKGSVATAFVGVIGRNQYFYPKQMTCFLRDGREVKIKIDLGIEKSEIKKWDKYSQ